MTKIRNIYNYIGWAGATVALVAYTLNTQGVIASKSFVFLAMNTFGCSCLIAYTFIKKAYANTVINSVYLAVTLLAMVINFIGLWK